MEMTFGKYKGKPVAWVLLKDPGYIAYLINNDCRKQEIAFALYLTKSFDSMPYKDVGCHVCGKTPTHLKLYNQRYTGRYFFCETCKPKYVSESVTTSMVHSIFDALFLPDADRVVAAMSKAKGAPGRLTSKALADFFGYITEISSEHPGEITYRWIR